VITPFILKGINIDMPIMNHMIIEQPRSTKQYMTCIYRQIKLFLEYLKGLIDAEVTS